jgi:hypothetical protein
MAALEEPGSPTAETLILDGRVEPCHDENGVDANRPSLTFWINKT